MSRPTIATVPAVAGAVIVLATSLLGGLTIFVAVFAIWALLPYAGLLALRTRLPRAMLAGAGLAALAVEIGIRLSVFVYPRGSTAAVALVFSPAFIAAIAMPAGAAGGWLVGRAWRTSYRWLRPVSAGAAVVVLALIMVRLGRPDLFPTTVYNRRQAIGRIGTPRVAAGGDAFERVTVSDRAEWRLTGEFDGEPGDEIALVDGQRIRLLTPATLTERAVIPLAGDARSRWAASSTLARSQGQLVIVDTGGGFQPTRVRALSGEERWNFRPDPALPPTSLQPADLDGDGDAEFYAAATNDLFRLDAAGHAVWRKPLALGAVIATAPRSARDPGWVVVDSQGRVVVFDERGTRLSDVVLKDARVVGTVDWPDARLLVAGGSALRLLRPDGLVVFDWALPDMTISDAVPVRLDAAAPAAIALVGSGPRDTARWRIQIVTGDKALLYDAIVDTAPRLLVAHGADGLDRLFIGGASLDVLRPRASR
jgi:hypothetical protein